MEILQGNSLYSSFYLKQAKMSSFFSVFLCKIREQEGRIVPEGGGGVGTSRRER
jgi:hypothetical protein